ncbi:MAG: hypothetical protein IKZ59_02595 [Clostridia bacterium]|nr:hypothetical protein [Clostridia bacterium]
MVSKKEAVFGEYEKAKSQKEALGEKGLYEQTKINARFYSGNQWYGANCGNDRPLVRHNIIKRIGDFKMSQILSGRYDVSYFAGEAEDTGAKKSLRAEIKEAKTAFSGEVGGKEAGVVCRALSAYFKQCAKRLDLDSLSAEVLKRAYIGGCGVLYTYFDSEADTGMSLYGNKIRGDIACEVLDVRDVYFADKDETDVQAQPYIIIAAKKDKQAVLRQAHAFGTENALKNLKADDDGKVLVLTKLYKEYKKDGAAVFCVKVTEDGVLRPDFDTKLHYYPLCAFRFDELDGGAYGESEVTYLIPNQIAVNRMITASVWSNIASGMPMMIVNGDTVSGEITNDPGQIIKIFGTNEDVAGAVKYVSPPDYSAAFNAAVNNLIENTLTQCGASPSALGDERAQNASAITRLQTAALMPINVLKSRYREFLVQNAKIWADFWLGLYGDRKIRIEDESGVWFFPFDAQRYAGISIGAAVGTGEPETFTATEKTAVLGELYDKGIITAKQYVSRLPDALLSGKQEIINGMKEKKNED